MFTIHAMVGKRQNQINMPRLYAYLAAHNTTSLIMAASRKQPAPSSESEAINNAMAIALLTLALPVVLFMGVGVSAFVLELTRAMALAGPTAMAVIALGVTTGFVLRKCIASRARA